MKKEAEETWEQNPGVCVKCGHNPADPNGTISPYYCKECNDVVEYALCQAVEKFIDFESR